jgi:opacity protein-like surface antigen
MNKLLVAAASIVAGSVLLAASATAQTSSSLRLVVLGASTPGTAATLPSAGSQVTFDLQTAASEPWVSVACSQGGRSVYGQYWGFWTGYSPSTITSTMAANGVFTLSSALWSSGPASCTATLYTVSPKNFKQSTLATLPFTVNG